MAGRWPAIAGSERLLKQSTLHRKQRWLRTHACQMSGETRVVRLLNLS